MPRLPGDVCCRFFSSPARLRRTPHTFRLSSDRSTTACSIETWRCFANGRTRRLLACPMDVGSRSPCSQPVAFLLRRHKPKYRGSLIIAEVIRAWFGVSILLPCSPPLETSCARHLRRNDRYSPALVASRGICLFKRILGASGLFGEGKWGKW